MTTILLPPPPPPSTSALGSHYWHTRRSQHLYPRADSDSVELPSIRQVIPELELGASDCQRYAASWRHQPPQTWTPSTPSMTCEYTHSPIEYSRRNTHAQENDLLRPSHHSSRSYPSPERPCTDRMWPVYQRPPTADDSWTRKASAHNTAPGTTGPHEFGPGAYRHSSSHMPSTLTGTKGRQEAHYTDDYASSQRMSSQTPSLASRSSPAYRYQLYEYGSSRYNHHRMSPARPSPLDNRSPFVASRHSLPPQDVGRFSQGGVVGVNDDVKPRKRRGNLPKATTDRLRGWFVAHLQHPYPTEDEKQCLMRQTGLQMNQISNWFINARRRQLPAMINNARAETNVMHSCAVASRASVTSSTDRSDTDTTMMRREST